MANRDLIQEQAQLLERAAALRSSADEAGVEVAAQRARIEELEKASVSYPVKSSRAQPRVLQSTVRLQRRARSLRRPAPH